MADPEAVRRRAVELFCGFEELENAEQLIMPVLLDAISIVEAYRRVRRHDVSYLPELTRSVDALLRELEIIERTNQWAAEAPADDSSS